MSRPLVAILACAVLEASGIALIFPTLPNLLRVTVGTDNASALYRTLLALHALTQLVVTPVLGVLSDRLGRRPVLLLALTGSTIDELVLSFTPYEWAAIPSGDRRPSRPLYCERSEVQPL